MDNNILIDLKEVQYSGMNCCIFFLTVMFTKGLCVCKYELFAFVKAWEFLVS